MTRAQWVYLVDDDEAIRKSTSFMLGSAGFAVRTFCTGTEFLQALHRLEPGCVVLDLGIPGIRGLQIQAAIRERDRRLPIIVITGHGDTGLAAQSLQAGASGFFEKPFERASFVEAIAEAFRALADDGHAQRRRKEAQARLLLLSAGEMNVLQCLVGDSPARTIALQLGLSLHMVELHRASLMQKLEASNLAETLRIAFVAGMGEG